MKDHAIAFVRRAFVGIALVLGGCLGTPNPPQIEETAAMRGDLVAGARFDPTDFLRLINDYRRQNGLGPLRLDPMLTRAAGDYARAIAAADRLTHTLPPYGGIAERLPRAGYALREAAENIGEGQHSVAAIFKAWRLSSEHDANMRLKDITDIGLAYAINPQTKWKIFWVLELGDRRTLPPTYLGGAPVPPPLAILR